ncbi:DVU3141 family protein [Marinobacter metalliresistant]|uniref:Uncharacterized protein n=1 Tax=Marinobacter metalliresistant TaxID=2961995 RepID=A0ABZ2W571_9GAMM
MYTGDSITYLSEAHSNEVEQAGPGEVVSLARTPWGENIRIEMKARYFSASGKPCFSTTIISQGVAPDAVNLCKYGSGRWGATRAFSPAETDRPQLTVGDAK